MTSVNRSLSIIRSCRGMTLLEIMLAMLVMTMVVSMVSLSLSGSLKVVDATRSQGELYYRAQVALQRISEDLASALLVDGIEFVGENEEIDGLRADSLEFTSTAHIVFDPDNDYPGIAFISYTVIPDGTSEGELLLLRRDDLLASTDITARGDEEKGGYLLCDRLRSVSFTFFDETGEEYDIWNTFIEDETDPPPRKLPVSVQCTLEFWLDRVNESSIEFTTRILLPVGLINAESS